MFWPHSRPICNSHGGEYRPGVNRPGPIASRSIEVMSKFTSLIAGLIASAAPFAPAAATVFGPHTDVCESGKPAMLVRVEGLKSRTGILRVQLYGGDPARYFDKGTYLDRVEFRTPAAGPVDVCVPVPRPGLYAVSVRHDANGNGAVDVSTDGGGFSGNPSYSLLDAMFKRKPSPVEVQVHVTGLTPVPVVLNYVHGASLKPIGGAK
jgi:uncharacterized protein (DUF2141 family)